LATSVFSRISPDVLKNLFRKNKIMPVSRSESRNDVADAQLECQQELEALERQYRKMKNEKKSYRVETDNILRRQECEIEKLAKEHENIEALLNVSVSRYNKDFDKGNVKKLNILLEKDTFIQQASFEGIHALVTIDKRITATKEEVLKKQLFCMNAQPLDQFAIQRHTRIMENRVYNANMRSVMLRIGVIQIGAGFYNSSDIKVDRLDTEGHLSTRRVAR
jgi:hypothetical protein